MRTHRLQLCTGNYGVENVQKRRSLSFSELAGTVPRLRTVQPVGWARPVGDQSSRRYSAQTLGPPGDAELAAEAPLTSAASSEELCPKKD